MNKPMCTLEENNKARRGKIKAIMIHNLEGITLAAECQSQIKGFIVTRQHVTWSLFQIIYYNDQSV